MSKKVIWTIVVLMTAAVVGVAWLQVNLIRTSIKVNEEKFTANVYTVLNNVVKKLKEEEERQDISHYANGFSTRQSATISDYFRTTQELSAHINVREKQQNILREGLKHQLAPQGHFCDNCRNEINGSLQRRIALYKSEQQNALSLQERIDVPYLTRVIKKQLKNIGINTDFHYGVFSEKIDNYIILDGENFKYRTSAEKNTSILEALSTSKYNVFLYPSSRKNIGKLMLFFPDKNNVVWSSLWKNLLGTGLFTSIILLCFAYTITIIFKQKMISQMKTDFINNMTHEFKTPIATISLATDAISSPKISGSPDKIQRFAKIIKQENKRMNNQVEKVLQMAVIDKREFSLNLTDINLTEIISQAVENISLQLEKRNGSILTDLQAIEPVIKGDLTHISNVINNLLDNANKYSPEKPEISVSTRNVANGLEVIISDKGMGMNKEVRKHIFDKFYRVHTGNLHDIKGFGLGLSYVKAIMTAHKGRVDVKSELGKGSDFILFFPIA